MELSDRQLLRYSRQIMLEGFDYQGQLQLQQSKVLVIGLGGLGCPAALYLAAAGVGELWLADHDEVELSNLQRQIAHGEADINRPKVISANEALLANNPNLQTRCISEKLTGQLLLDAVSRVDLVVDASDNFSTRFAVNRACLQHRKPLVSGAAIRSEGQVIVFDPRSDESPCYACLYEESTGDSQLSCSESGVLAPLVGVIGSMQALEAIKLLSSFGTVSPGKLLVFDAATMDWRTLRLRKNPDCRACQ